MSQDLSDLLGSFEEHTAASPEDLERLRAALPEDLGLSAGQELPQVAGRRRWVWALGLGAAAAAAALVAVLLQPGPAEDTPVVAALSSEGSNGHVAFGDAFTLTYEGQGRLEGSLQHPRIQWEQGRIRVDANPESMVDLAVITRDGEVWVEGTIFDVDKDLLGTHVELLEGMVRVRCSDGSSTSLESEGSTTCLPTTAGGLLGRARALQDLQSPTDEVLRTVGLGLTKSGPDSPIGSELTALKISLLVDLGRSEEALQAALVFLDSPASLRRVQVARTALSLGLDASDCPAAEAALLALADQASPEERGLFEACGTVEPAR